jgi:hypothetical protein
MIQIEKVLYTAKPQTTGAAMEERPAPLMAASTLSFPFRALPAQAPTPSSCSLWNGRPATCRPQSIVAARMKMRLPAETAVDAAVDLGATDGDYLLQARLNVSPPGIEREVAQALADGAHLECPYSKATRGNLNVVTNLVDVKCPTAVA